MAGSYFQEFGSSAIGATDFGDGASLTSTHGSNVAGVVDANLKELRMTLAGTTDTRSAFMLPSLDASPVYAFSAKWNAQISGNFPSAGDGFSFNFGQLAALALTSGALESGYDVGLSFGVQTYDGNNPGFYLRINGVTYISQAYTPATQWGVNNPFRHFFEVDWNFTNGMTVRLNGQTLFANVPTYGFVPKSGDRFVWAARSGSLTETIALDNILVLTGGTLDQRTVTSPYFNHPSDFFPASVFDNLDSTTWQTFASTGIIGGTLTATNNVRAYALTSYDGADRSSDPRGWRLDGSTNGGGTWATLGSGSGLFSNAMETRAWSTTNLLPHGALRLNITNNNGNGSVTRLGELRPYGFTVVPGPTWTRISINELNTQQWSSVAINSNASYVLAGTWNNFTWLYGYYSPSSWTYLNTPQPMARSNWMSLAMSADGKAFLGVAFQSNLYGIVNSDFGPNWGSRASAGIHSWRSVAMSEDGVKQVAVASDNTISLSTNTGQAWAAPPAAPSLDWRGVASSSDGSKLAAIYHSGGSSGGMHISTNAGANWATVPGIPTQNWDSVAMSGDGTKLAVGRFLPNFSTNVQVYVSTNGGASWSPTPIYIGNSTPTVRYSRDGSVLGAAIGYEVFISRDYGSTWLATSPTNGGLWEDLAITDNGDKIVAVNFFNGIWVYDIAEAVPLPIISGQSATNLTQVSAHLNAGVNPNRLPTSAWFQWGTTTNLGNSTVVQALGAGSNSVPVSATLTGLTVGTYYFRTVATNVIGAKSGPITSFAILSTNAYFNIAFPGDTVIPTSVNSPGGQGADKAIDGVAGTKYLNFDKLNTGFTVFPSVTTLAVRAIGLISAEDEPARDPAAFVLYGSPDGTNFHMIVSNAVPAFAGRNNIQSFSFANTNLYAAYRIIFPTVQDPDAANSMQIAMVQFLPYGDITTTNDALDLSLPIGSGLNGIGPAEALIDRRLLENDAKIVALNYSSNAIMMIRPKVGRSILKGIELIGGNDDATFPTRMPSSITVEGSHDDIGYTLLGQFMPVLPVANMAIQGFNVFGQQTAYEYYKLTFGAPKSGNVLQVGEIRLFGISPPPLGLAPTGGSVLFTWPASGFALQYSTNFPSSAWLISTNAVEITNGMSRSASSDPQTYPSRIYRLSTP